MTPHSLLASLLHTAVVALHDFDSLGCSLERGIRMTCRHVQLDHTVPNFDLLLGGSSTEIVEQQTGKESCMPSCTGRALRKWHVLPLSTTCES